MSGTAEVRAAHATAHDRLTRAWSRRPGFVGWLTAVNHKDIGIRFIVTAFAFLVVGGVFALLMRTQLALPENDFLSAEAYNELFTMHGTTMMFLFAVPVLEGLGMYFLPLMLGTRDLPFPRLNAFGYWVYLFGGLLVYASFLTGSVPRAGWFAYPPLSGPVFTPDRSMDFWLLGVTLTEIAAIVGAIELVVVFAKRRAPGMTLERVPVFAWSIVVTAAMILVAFPALVAASVLLELERVFDTRFFDAAAGGDPLLWQHLFWFFGHPEVYIIFIPAAGIVSMVLPVFARRRLAAYGLVVASIVATAIISFGLWIHHMFTVGLPLLALSFFAAASFLIVIPNGVQVFAWLTTLARGRPRLDTPLLFVVGFLVIFVLGGITGVMVAAVPFDWQVHDSFFVVAHFHYVLIGGMVFPLFAGIYYWFPKWTGRLLDERLGKASFWIMFGGFNLAFFPQHIAGLEGMPRRVFTYQWGDGWAVENMLSTIGAFIFAGGIAITLLAAAGALRRPGDAPADPWGAGSLEWATTSPPPTYNFERIPTVADADPLWDERGASAPGHEQLVDALADAEHGRREVVETTAVGAAPERIVSLPGPSGWPLLASVALLLALVGALLYSPAVASVGAAALAAALAGWVLTTAGGRSRPDHDFLPVAASGAGRWGVALGVVAAGVVLGSLLFAYGLLAAKSPWPPEGMVAPDLLPALVGIALAGLVTVATVFGRRRSYDAGPRTLASWTIASTVLSAALLGALVWTVTALELDPRETAYGSITVVLVGWQIALTVALLGVLAVVLWHAIRGNAHHADDVSVHIGSWVALFTAASAVLVLALVTLGPRWFS